MGATILTSGVTLLDAAKQQVISMGTGPMTLGGAVTGNQTAIAAGVLSGATVHYRIDDIGNSWEVGTGVLTITGSVVTVTRTPEASSAGGTAIGLSGSAVVSFPALAVDFIQPPNPLSGLVTAPAEPGWDVLWASYFSDLVFSNSNKRATNNGAGPTMLYSAPAIYNGLRHIELVPGSTTNVSFGLVGSAGRIFGGGTPNPAAASICSLIADFNSGGNVVAYSPATGDVTLGTWHGFSGGDRVAMDINTTTGNVWLSNVTAAPTTYNAGGSASPQTGVGGYSYLPVLAGGVGSLLWAFGQVQGGTGYTFDIFEERANFLGTVFPGWTDWLGD
jgi:hypothetical protein